MIDLALTYDDIALVPSFSDIESRSYVNLTTKLSRNYNIQIPVVASPMDTVCDSEMAIAMAELGGVGCIHRFMSIEEQAKSVRLVQSAVNGNIEIPVMAAVGANGDYLERARELVGYGANVILIDVAHGDHSLVKTAIEKLKSTLPAHVDIIAGNVATGFSARNLESWGADAIRVGIGGGSLCSTRIRTGFGVPNVTAISDCVESVTIPVIADGGIRSSGDIAKALAVGADSVMLGSLLAGTEEAPGQIIETKTGLFKRYRGAASLETKITHGQTPRNVEGESTTIPFKGGVRFILGGLMDGVRSALSYCGARTIGEFDPQIVRVTSAGITEAKPHLL